MKVVETQWWTLALPPEWWAEAEEASILIGDHDDVGCIEISTLCKDEGVFAQEELRTIARQEAEQSADWREATLGDFTGVTAQFSEEEAAIREWYVACDSLMLFITYSCDEENRGMDDAAVDQLLDTLIRIED